MLFPVWNSLNKLRRVEAMPDLSAPSSCTTPLINFAAKYVYFSPSISFAILDRALHKPLTVVIYIATIAAWSVTRGHSFWDKIHSLLPNYTPRGLHLKHNMAVYTSLYIFTLFNSLFPMGWSSRTLTWSEALHACIPFCLSHFILPAIVRASQLQSADPLPSSWIRSLSSGFWP